MSSYAAFLGHQPAISLAELGAYTGDLVLRARPAAGIVVFDTAAHMDRSDFTRIGGTVVLAQRLSDQSVDLDDVPALLINEVSGIKGKVTFSLRTQGLSSTVVRNLYRDCKDRLKKAGRVARYVGNERHAAVPVLLRDEGLLDDSHGVELTILRLDEQTIWIGKTIAAHDPDAYTERDIGKPVRDTTTGLLPPKLAQILLNCGAWMAAGSGKDAMDKRLTVFDPFCGTGVIPMESLLHGWNILASDASVKAINGTTKNLAWLRKRRKIPAKEPWSGVWKQDATKPFVLDKKTTGIAEAKPDMIVTETSLGPNLRKRPTLKEAQGFLRDAEKLEDAFLANAAATLPGVPIVCTWPVWYLRTGPLFLERIWDAAAKHGYTPCLPPGAEQHHAKRNALLYRRPDQFVGREIVLLRPR